LSGEGLFFALLILLPAQDESVISIENQSVSEFDGSYEEYNTEKNKPKINKQDRKSKDELLILQNRLSEVISLLSLEVNLIKKEEYEKEYYKLLKDINEIRRNI
jgi:macrolide transport system ATP-binding/permease protein